MSNHPADAGKMVCRHWPIDTIATDKFPVVCKHCWVQIEAEFCQYCDGANVPRSRCFVCIGTGVERFGAAQ